MVLIESTFRSEAALVFHQPIENLHHHQRLATLNERRKRNELLTLFLLTFNLKEQQHIRSFSNPQTLYPSKNLSPPYRLPVCLKLLWNSYLFSYIKAWLVGDFLMSQSCILRIPVLFDGDTLAELQLAMFHISGSECALNLMSRLWETLMLSTCFLKLTILSCS